MPIYEFRCAACGNRFEKLCSCGESGERLSCPDCGARAPKRVMSSFSAAGTSGGKSACGGCSTHNCANCGH